MDTVIPILREPGVGMSARQRRMECLLRTLSHTAYWVASSVLLAVVIGCLIFSSFDRKSLCQKLERLNHDLKPYQNERMELVYSLRDLNTEYSAKIIGSGTAVITFTTLDKTVYTKAYQQMKEYGFVGCLALSDTQLPGMDGCMSKKQFNELIDNGWEVCLLIGKDKTAGENFRKAVAALEKENISIPKTVIFENKAYTDGYNHVLEQLGFTAAVHHGENGESIVTYDYTDNFTELGCMGWNTSYASSRLKLAMENGGNIVFTVGEDCAYEGETFAKMLARLDEYSSEGNLTVTGLEEAADYHRNVYLNRPEVKDELADKAADIEDQINAIDSEMRTVYAKYGW